MKRAIKMNIKDNVVTVLDDVSDNEIIEIVSKRGETIGEVKMMQPVRFGHKVALKWIERGAKIIKYGEVIGTAIKVIEEGEHVHIHNVESLRIPTAPS